MHTEDTKQRENKEGRGGSRRKRGRSVVGGLVKKNREIKKEEKRRGERVDRDKKAKIKRRHIKNNE